MKSITYIVPFSLLICVSGSAQMTMEQALQAGKDYSTSSDGYTKGSSVVTETKGQEVVPNYNSDAPESNVYQGGKQSISGNGIDKIATCQSSVAGTSYDQQECEVIKYLNQDNTATQVELDKDTDPLLIGSKSIIANATPESSGAVSACHIETVETDATYTEQTCYQTPGVDTLTCDKVLTVDCEYPDGTSIGGLLPESFSATATMTYEYDENVKAYKFFFGVVPPAFQGDQTFFTDRFTFTVNDVSQLNYFNLVHVYVDDRMIVRVNGHDVYYAPDDIGYWHRDATKVGGRVPVPARNWLGCTSALQYDDRRSQDIIPMNGDACIPGTEVYGPRGTVSSCTTYEDKYFSELGYQNDSESCYPKAIDYSINWETDGESDVHISLSLLPYIKTGENTITLYNLKGGSWGGGFIEFYTQLKADRVCTDTWTDNCTDYEARTQ